MQKKIQVFFEFQKNFISYILIRAIVRKLDGSGNESKDNKKKGKIVPQYSNNDRLQIIYEYYILEAFLLVSGGDFRNQNI